MNDISAIFKTSLGKKYVMAITGLALFAFVIVHMLGNLQIFLGSEAINSYAAFLKSKPALVWSARVGLLALAVIHLVCAFQLARENKEARPVPYAEAKPAGASYASRTMLVSGVIILVFIVYHLLHFTVAVPEVNFLRETSDFPEANFLELKDSQDRHDVYRMMILGYSNIWVSGFYILGMALLCLHLSHGVSSLFQSLGVKTQPAAKWADRFAIVSAAVIFIGNSSIPVAVLLGFGR